jgi:hypothetical protein
MATEASQPAPPPSTGAGPDIAPESSPLAQLLQEAIKSVPDAEEVKAGAEPMRPSKLGVGNAAAAAPPAAVALPPSADARTELAAKSVAMGDWRRVATDLGPLDKAGELPPTLALLCALAHHESAPEDDDGNQAQRANELAMRSMATLFGVQANNPLALVLAKRLLRKNPSAWRTRPAPPAKTSFLIVAATLAIGSGIGWLLTSPMGRYFYRLLFKH